MSPKIESFNFSAGRKIGARYLVESRLGGGSEGEVYQIRELDTGVVRAAKLYFPHRDPKRRLSIRHAQKLNILRNCPIVLQYHHSEVITVKKQKVVAMISDLCEGEPLEQWVVQHRGKRLSPYTALHVFYNLVRGLETIHAMGEYHADVHSQNILVRPTGVRFELKLIDFYDWGTPRVYKQKQDLCDAVHVFHECLGGREQYARLPAEIKYICAGLRRDTIIKRFTSMSALRIHLENFEWTSVL